VAEGFQLDLASFAEVGKGWGSLIDVKKPKWVFLRKSGEKLPTNLAGKRLGEKTGSAGRSLGGWVQRWCSWGERVVASRIRYGREVGQAPQAQGPLFSNSWTKPQEQGMI
jgi:hypothetical protein